MKVLVIGGGGREHAIVKTLKKSGRVSELHCAPGNAGIAGDCRVVPIKADDLEKLIQYVRDENIDYTVVGMDDPLAAGIVDLFLNENRKIFGPVKAAAKLEWSKAYSKALMQKYGIPTAAYAEFDDYEAALEYVKNRAYPIWIKTDGLAMGKGAVGCRNFEEAESALKSMMLDKAFGASGEKVVIEDNLEGTEFTVLAFCDGKTVKPMPSSQDYKRAQDGGAGLNTGGMGAVSPAFAYTGEIRKECEEKIFGPTIHMLVSEGIDYRGVIYFGLIATPEGVKVIEYNSRFGDPETQVVLPRLKTDLLEIFMACSEGRLDGLDIEWDDNFAVCVCAASGGYPAFYEKGKTIAGLDALPEDVICFHAGTAEKDGEIITNGGRVLGITALGASLEAARAKAYNAIEAINFEKMHFRRDIGI